MSGSSSLYYILELKDIFDLSPYLNALFLILVLLHYFNRLSSHVFQQLACCDSSVSVSFIHRLLLMIMIWLPKTMIIHNTAWLNQGQNLMEWFSFHLQLPFLGGWAISSVKAYSEGLWTNMRWSTLTVGAGSLKSYMYTLLSTSRSHEMCKATLCVSNW